MITCAHLRYMLCGCVVQKERKEQLRKRGNPDTHTSDARFDEQFQLGYGLAGQKVQPTVRYRPSYT